MTQRAGSTKTTEDGEYPFRRSSETRLRLQTTSSPFPDARKGSPDEKHWTVSTSIKDMNEVTSALPARKNRCGILGLRCGSSGKALGIRLAIGARNTADGIARVMLSGCLLGAIRLRGFLRRMRRTLTSGDDGQCEAVYDLLRCGPRSRFCTPWAVAHNCLGLGFGLGPGKFVRIVKQWTGKDITPEEAKVIVRDFREKNAPIVKLWRYLERSILSHDRDPGVPKPSKAVLPSGREIRYFDLLESGRDDEGGMSSWSGRVVRGEPRKKIWGGLLSENVTQATARDILAVKIRESEDAGMPVVLHVHDEIVVEVPEADAEEAKTELNRIMSTAPEWAPGLPMRSDTKILRRYGK